MNDLTILCMYVFVFALIKGAGSLSALLVFTIVAYTASIADFEEPLDDAYLYMVYWVMYLICAIRLKRLKNEAWAGCIFVSLYYLWFSIDSWFNWEIETWTHQNHESVVFAAHVLVMLLLISARRTVVFTRVNLFWRNRCSTKSD